MLTITENNGNVPKREEKQSDHRHHGHASDEGDFFNTLGWGNELFGSFAGTALFIAFVANCFHQSKNISSTTSNADTPLDYSTLSLIIGASVGALAAPGSAHCHNLLEVLNLLKDAINKGQKTILMGEKSIIVADFQAFVTDALATWRQLSPLQWLYLLGDALAHVGEFSGLLITSIYILLLNHLAAMAALISITLLGTILAITPEILTCFLTLVEMNLLAKNQLLKMKKGDENSSISVQSILDNLTIFSAYFKIPTTLLSVMLFFGGIFDPLLISPSTPREYLGLSIYAVCLGLACAVYPSISSVYGAYIINYVANNTMEPVNESMPKIEEGYNIPEILSEQSIAMKNPVEDKLIEIVQSQHKKSIGTLFSEFMHDVRNLSGEDQAMILGRMISRGSETAAIPALPILLLSRLSSQAQAGLILFAFVIGVGVNISDARLLTQNTATYRDKTQSSLWKDFSNVYNKTSILCKISFVCSKKSRPEQKVLDKKEVINPLNSSTLTKSLTANEHIQSQVLSCVV